MDLILLPLRLEASAGEPQAERGWEASLVGMSAELESRFCIPVLSDPFSASVILTEFLFPLGISV